MRVPRAAALLLAVAAGVLDHAATSRVIYVNQAATGANTGADWANAFTSLEAGLLAADTGDEVWVAQGIYEPAGSQGFEVHKAILRRRPT